MAALYSRIERRVWLSADVRALGHGPITARELWIYLLCSPAQTAFPGLFSIGAGGIADHLDCERSEVRRALDEIVARGMAKIDHDAGLIWLPKALDRAVDSFSNPKHTKGWRNAWDSLPACALRDEAFDAAFGSLVAFGTDASAKAFGGHPIANRLPITLPITLPIDSGSGSGSGSEREGEGLSPQNASAARAPRQTVEPASNPARPPPPPARESPEARRENRSESTTESGAESPAEGGLTSIAAIAAELIADPAAPAAAAPKTKIQAAIERGTPVCLSILLEHRDLWPEKFVPKHELEAVARRMVRAIENEPAAQGEARNALIDEAIAMTRTHRARFTAATPEQLIAKCEEAVTRYLLGDARAGKRKPRGAAQGGRTQEAPRAQPTQPAPTAEQRAVIAEREAYEAALKALPVKVRWRRERLQNLPRAIAMLERGPMSRTFFCGETEVQKAAILADDAEKHALQLAEAREKLAAAQAEEAAEGHLHPMPGAPRLRLVAG
jgi:hypothetical protein